MSPKAPMRVGRRPGMDGVSLAVVVTIAVILIATIVGAVLVVLWMIDRAFEVMSRSTSGITRALARRRTT